MRTRNFDVAVVDEVATLERQDRKTAGVRNEVTVSRAEGNDMIFDPMVIKMVAESGDWNCGTVRVTAFGAPIGYTIPHVG